jgi:3',5'-cyclic-nucleotide phosphodiesterase
LQLLSRFSADLQVRDEPNLIVPIAIIRSVGPTKPATPVADMTADRGRMSRCLDAGAVDVLNAPLEVSRVHGLVVHAYRVHKSALKEQSRFLPSGKVRKQSWVGVHDQQPYAYLREAM